MTKPFNLDHARAGAPYACANGEEATVLKWDRRNDYPLLGIAGKTDSATTWERDGTASTRGSPANLVMLPLATVEGREVYVGDELCVRTNPSDVFNVLPGDKDLDFEDFTWPAPKKVYPETRMTDRELTIIRIDSGMFAAANVAIRRAIDDGDVIITPAASTMLGTETKHEVWGSKEAIALVADRFAPQPVKFVATFTNHDDGVQHKLAGTPEACEFLEALLKREFDTAGRSRRECTLIAAVIGRAVTAVQQSSSLTKAESNVGMLKFDDILKKAGDLQASIAERERTLMTAVLKECVGVVSPLQSAKDMRSRMLLIDIEKIRQETK